ncbi:Uncharacterised protein [Mycobacteroides abscessus subsp. abscessus]|nr:Uncharacterised protein [Mycobacteroides abscessus subsp. abscessus]
MTTNCPPTSTQGDGGNFLRLSRLHGPARLRIRTRGIHVVIDQRFIGDRVANAPLTLRVTVAPLFRRRIWLARRSSRFYISRSLMRGSSAVVPGRSPASTRSWSTHDRSVSGFTPGWSPIRRKMPQRASRSASRTKRTALSPSAKRYLPWGATLPQADASGK